MMRVNTMTRCGANRRRTNATRLCALLVGLTCVSASKGYHAKVEVKYNDHSSWTELVPDALVWMREWENLNRIFIKDVKTQQKWIYLRQKIIIDDPRDPEMISKLECDYVCGNSLDISNLRPNYIKGISTPENSYTVQLRIIIADQKKANYEDNLPEDSSMKRPKTEDGRIWVTDFKKNMAAIEFNKDMARRYSPEMQAKRADAAAGVRRRRSEQEKQRRDRMAASEFRRKRDQERGERKRLKHLFKVGDRVTTNIYDKKCHSIKCTCEVVKLVYSAKGDYGQSDQYSVRVLSPENMKGETHTKLALALTSAK